MSQSGAILLYLALAAHSHQVNETICMAQALYYEARGEGERGQKAVAEVILHRVRSSRRPGTVCGVVYEPYQFSFVNDGSTRRKLEPKAWKDSVALAQRIMRGEVALGITRRAQFYHEVSIRPEWTKAMTQTARIGNHIFYRQKDG